MFRYFGTHEYRPEGWESGFRVPIPIGETCPLCDEAFDQGDKGSYSALTMGKAEDIALIEEKPVHAECIMYEVLGAVSPSNNGLSYRESAISLYQFMERSGLPTIRRRRYD